MREATVTTNRPITTIEIEPLSEVNFLRKERRANSLHWDLLSDFLCRDPCAEILLTQIDGLQPRTEIPITFRADLQPRAEMFLRTGLEPRAEMFLRTCRNLSLRLIINKGKG